MKELGLYIHIPFCDRKCNYCDFLSFKAEEETQFTYVEALLNEIKSYKEIAKDYLVDTIYIGGGTPSLINAHLISTIMHNIKEIFIVDKNAEITIEVNPGTVNEMKLKRYYQAGINRVSFGLQSAINEELKLLGRIHNYNDFVESYTYARNVGFNNISIDLISALPEQRLDNWIYTLDKVVALKPEHISAYTLIIEEGTQFYDRYVKVGNLFDLLDEDLDREIYHKTKEILHKHGYNRYEISNYSLATYESKHNKKYWTNKEYLGFGIGAATYIDGKRLKNISNISHYMNKLESSKIIKDFSSNDLGLRDNIELLTKEEMMSEYIFLGLRLISGINKREFLNTFNVDIKDVYGDELISLKEKGLIEESNDKIALTDFGIDVSNYVFEKFI